MDKEENNLHDLMKKYLEAKNKKEFGSTDDYFESIAPKRRKWTVKPNPFKRGDGCIQIIHADGRVEDESDAVVIDVSNCRDCGEIEEAFMEASKRYGRPVILTGEDDIPWRKEQHKPEYTQTFQIGDIVKIKPEFFRFSCVDVTEEELDREYYVAGVEQMGEDEFRYHIENLHSRRGKDDWFLNGNEIFLVRRASEA